ncbi:hypothetical protein HDU98_006882 [Podochytrium sp. JEL0797]|nr:hypothetical protein HDU98_006882 [Podochytrium sp. JEL0797]
MESLSGENIEVIRLETFGSKSPTFLKLLRPTIETTKESTNRNKFSAAFSSESNHTVSTLHYSNSTGPRTLLQTLNSITDLLFHSEWVFFLEPGALLADPIGAAPFSKQLDAFITTNQLFIVFKHCETLDSGSLLIHSSMRDLLLSFIQTHDLSSPTLHTLQHHLHASFSLLPGTSLFTCPSYWLHKPVTPSNFRNFTIHDRISADTLRLTADFYFGDMPIPDLMVESLENGLIGRIRREGDGSGLVVGVPERNGTVIFVDGWSLADWVENVAPQINTSYILLSGDGDQCGPECYLTPTQITNFTTSPLLLHWHVMNCKGIDANETKISCIPIGLNQWGDKREHMQTAYRMGVGLRHGLEWRSAREVEKSERYLLASFGIWTNPPIRQPVYDLFCNSTDPTRESINAHINCQFGQVSQLEFYTSIMAASRFALSPHGAGLDCYRTYESLFMNVIPVVVTSSLDELYAELPVLILERWEDLTVELMEVTEREFEGREWNLRQLYTEYWYHKVREGLE